MEGRPISWSAAPVVWLQVSWPREVSTPQVAAVLSALNGLSTPGRREVIVVELRATAGRVEHRFGLPARRQAALSARLRAAVPGIGLETITPLVLPSASVARVRCSTRLRPLELKQSALVATALLGGLAEARSGEVLLLRWLLGPVRRPLAVPGRTRRPHAEPWWLALLRAPIGAPPELDSEARAALIGKQGRPGWRAAGLVAVVADGRSRQRQLLGGLASALHSAHGPGAVLTVRPTTPRTLAESWRPWWWDLALNIDELAGLGAFPAEVSGELPLLRSPSRTLSLPSGIARTGRVLGDATHPGQERPVALTVRDSLHHLHLCGPTGTGKSTLLLNLITQDLAAGRGLVVIEPKGDLIADVLARVPPDRVEDVVLLDPADPARAAGLNPLRSSWRPAEVTADHLLAVFRGLFADSWGPRTNDVLSAGLLSLVGRSEATLCALPLLFTEAAYRRRVVGALRDPLALGPFWTWFEGLSVAERATVLAPLMNKLRSFLLRPTLRAIIGQSTPRFEMAEVFTRRRVLLVSLAAGLIGAEAARLLGALVIAQLWQTAQGRSAVPADRRHPVFVYIDEFQDYLHLPTDLGDVLAQARGLGVGLNLAHQHLAQLPPAMRSAVLANARSRVIFQTSVDEAGPLVREDRRLSADDVAGLPAHQAYARLMVEASARPFVSIVTRPAPSPIGDAEAVRTVAGRNFAVARQAVEAELAGLAGRHHANAHDVPLGSRPRQSGGRR